MTEPRKLSIPNKQWAHTFLALQSASDESALQFLSDIMENTFSRDERLEFMALRHLVDSLLELNIVIIEMETGGVQFDLVIDEIYRSLMAVLIELCNDCLAL